MLFLIRRCGDDGSNVGKVCTPQGTPDPNATYKYGSNDACVMTCKTGYKKKDGACVEKTPSPSGGSPGPGSSPSGGSPRPGSSPSGGSPRPGAVKSIKWGGKLSAASKPAGPGPAGPSLEPTDTCVGGTVCPPKLTSPSGACIAKFQDDGSYVVYDGTGAIIWSSGTRNMGTGPYRTTMQSDGNFVLYDSTDTALWNSTTAGRGTGPYRAVMQDDCNFVVYGSGDQPTWSSIGGIVP